VWFIASFLVPLWPASCDLEGGRGVQRKLTPHSQHQRIYCAADMSSPKSKKRRSGAAPAVGASASSGAAIAGGGTATARVGSTEMEGGCIACGGSDHSHCTCVLVGAALYSWMLQLGPGKDMTLVVDIILRLLMWGWREARFGEEITCLSYTAVGDIISAGGSEGSVFFMSAQTGEKILCPVSVDYSGSRVDAVSSVSFSHDRDMITAGCYNGEIYFIDTQSGEVKRALNAHSGWVRAVSWSPCGKWLASGGDDKKINIYDAQTFQVKRSLNGHSR
jgi:hypothetical protein